MKSDFPFLVYRSAEEDVSVNAVIQDESVWLTQRSLAELFGVDVSTINYHLTEIYKSGELEEAATIRKIPIVQREGKRDVRREPLFYNLDAITGQTAAEYSIFNKTQQITSDFDRAVQKLIENQ